MPINLNDFAKEIDPKRTVLMFGAGSSMPSGAPSTAKLIEHFSKTFEIQDKGYTLPETTSLAEGKTSRPKLIRELRKFFTKLKPTGGLKNLPLYEWKSIFTTNYDDLIEQVYKLREKKLRIYHSNFDFTAGDETEYCELFKIHGTIERDISDDGKSRIIITEADYAQTEEYREFLYDRLKGDLAGANLIIIGQSLADPDLKDIVNRAVAINTKALSPSRISLLIYDHDEQRASLFEQRGINVIFGGIDDFFLAISKTLTENSAAELDATDSLHIAPALEPVTIHIGHAINTDADISSMFNGRAADYPDIESGFTFGRQVTDEIIDHFNDQTKLCAVILGASGVGKTTAARQVLINLHKNNVICWEHKSDHPLSVAHWISVAEKLKSENSIAVLFIDNAHQHLQNLNELIDQLVMKDIAYLKLLICSSKNQWYPRVKTPNMYKFGQDFKLSKLSPAEIERLLRLLDTSKEIRTLVESQFSGFNKEERRRRLIVRCESDMFVCLKNIFANDSFDDIVLREYADLDEPLREVYRYVAALETAGVRVHRQLIIRLLVIDAGHIQGMLNNLTDIIREYNIDTKKGIYGWQCRHSVIAGIVSKYKFPDLQQTISLFDSVIDNISPTYDIEIRSLRELCNIDSGIPRIPDKNEQNRLLRKMMSNAPGERVPRHRLIRNLIDQGHFEKAETEIRLFDNDFNTDGPVHRYKIKLLVERAVQSSGILNEDRLAILEQAHALAVQGADRYPANKHILTAYGELGIEFYRMTGKYDYFDEAISKLQNAEEKMGDPQISSVIARLTRRIAGQTISNADQMDVTDCTDTD